MEQKELSFEEMKKVYNSYINGLCKTFMIIEKDAFSRDIAKLIKNRPIDIESNKYMQEAWNYKFRECILRYTKYSLEELKVLFALDMGKFISKVGMEDGN